MRATASLTQGYKIQVEEIDFITIPLPDLRQSLHDNNLFYTLGSIPLELIRSCIPSTDVQNRLRIIKRTMLLIASEPLGYAFRGQGNLRQAH